MCGEEAHAEREEVLCREFYTALNRIEADIEKRFSRAERKVLPVKHGDTSG